MIATLLEVVTSHQSQKITSKGQGVSFDNRLAIWMNELGTVLNENPASETVIDPTYELHFVLSDIDSNCLLPCQVTPKLFRRLKSGKLGAEKRLSH